MKTDFSLWQHIDKVFKHKELQQQLMDAKLARITEMMKEVEEKQQRERDFVSTGVFSFSEALLELSFQILVVNKYSAKSLNKIS